MSQIATNPLRGLRVLIAEDNYLIGDYLRQILVDLECAVVGPIDNLDEVLTVIRTIEIDGALLDVQLGDQNVHPAASELLDRGIPFILTTGRAMSADLPASLSGAPLLTKPFDAGQLERLVGKTFRPPVGA